MIYNENGMKGIGFNILHYGILIYWYTKKNRPFISIKDYNTGKVNRI